MAAALRDIVRTGLPRRCGGAIPQPPSVPEWFAALSVKRVQKIGEASDDGDIHAKTETRGNSRQSNLGKAMKGI
ncbi:hypothetical protein GCM10009776_28130 [Microbacterium deminutum]|uniref:Uncharacterized protein n=1 Tax=Microbacterium deminutum TaxID=344164 RepID=A0ABN2R533_9MICO